MERKDITTKYYLEITPDLNTPDGAIICDDDLGELYAICRDLERRCFESVPVVRPIFYVYEKRGKRWKQINQSTLLSELEYEATIGREKAFALGRKVAKEHGLI